MIIKDNKKRHVISYENMSGELLEVFNEKYPKGFNDYLADLIQYKKPDGTPFYAVTVETSDSIYLVKIKVRTDDLEDLERWLDGEDDGDSQVSGGQGGDDDGGTPLPDDNISQYGGDDDSAD